MFRYEHIHVASEDAFVRRGMKLLERGIKNTIMERGQCILGLSGGATPGPVYEALATAPHSDSLPRGERMIDWLKVHLFLVDERYVPKDHAESNQRLIEETLLARAKIPRANLVFPKTALAIENCVRDYEDRLRILLAEAPPDIVVVGMGEDGHIASLFPDDRAALQEREKMILHTRFQYTSILKAARTCDRITVTLPLLASARSILFLLNGKGKKKIFEEMMAAPLDSIRYPAHALLQTGGTTWITAW